MKLSKIFTLSAAIIVPAAVLLSTTSCGSHKVLYIAHRGAPGGYNTAETKHFENNTESFVAGGQISKFYGLETDVYMTRDEHFVVVHDDKPFMAANGTRDTTKYLGGPDVTDTNWLSLTEALTTDLVPSHHYPNYVDGPDHHLTTFHDYLEICKSSNKTAIIEIKEPSHLEGTDLLNNGVIDKPKVDSEHGVVGTGYLLPQGNTQDKDYLEEIYQEIKSVGMLSKCKIISFWEPYINYFIEHNKTNDPVALQQLTNWYANPDDIDNNSDYQTIINRGIDLSAADSMTAYNGTLPDHPVWLPITKEMINYAHKHNVKFGAWTVNIESIAKTLTSWGVDYITTDYYQFVKSLGDEPLSFD